MIPCFCKDEAGLIIICIVSTSTSMAELMIIFSVLFIMDSFRMEMHHLYNMQCFTDILFLTSVANNFWDIYFDYKFKSTR